MHPLENLPLAEFPAPYAFFDCGRCRRHGQISVRRLEGTYGNKTMGELARLVAAAGGCNLAGEKACNVMRAAPPVHHWAELSHALRRGWKLLLRCERRHAALKTTKSCPGPIEIQVAALVAVLGYDFKLERLPARMSCPLCTTKAISLEGIVPPPVRKNTPLRVIGGQNGR
jgi:hypothetical protein